MILKKKRRFFRDINISILLRTMKDVKARIVKAYTELAAADPTNELLEYGLVSEDTFEPNGQQRFISIFGSEKIYAAKLNNKVRKIRLERSQKRRIVKAYQRLNELQPSNELLGYVNISGEDVVYTDSDLAMRIKFHVENAVGAPLALYMGLLERALKEAERK